MRTATAFARFALGLLLIHGSARAATYYIDYSDGNDANSGTAKTAPWKRHPYMKGWSGSYTHVAGDQFIFKGGVTWPNQVFQLYIGWGKGGSSESARDYYGVDTTWFAGDAWTRPVFDFEDTGFGGGLYTSAGILVDQAHYITFDGLQMKRHRAVLDSKGSDWGAGTVNLYSRSSYITFTNCYIHDWSLSGPDGGGAGGIVQANGSGPGIKVLGCTFTQANAAVRTGTAVRLSGEVAYCEIYDVVNAYLGSGTIHHNHIYNVVAATDPASHENALYCMSPSQVYNNHIHHLHADASAIYLSPSFTGQTGYDLVYNNLVYAVGNQAPVQIDMEGTSAPQTGSRVYNNTLEHGNNYCIRVVHRGGQKLGLLDCRNNHLITSGTAIGYGNPSIGLGEVTEVIIENNFTQPPTAAAGDGYTLSNQYAPTSSPSPTVNAGLDLSSIFTTDLHDQTRPAGQWDIGAYEFIGSSEPPQNSPPILAAISDQAIDEHMELIITLTASDPDLPAQPLTYSLDSGPTGASVDPSGIFRWTPDELQGPSTNSVTVRVTDNGEPALSDTKTVTVVVTEVNAAPVFTKAIERQYASEGQMLNVPCSATDPDLPENKLTYSLGAGPIGAKVNPNTGTFSWKVPKLAVGTKVQVTVGCTDDGVPALSAQTSFEIEIITKPRNRGAELASFSFNGSPNIMRWTVMTAAGHPVTFAAPADLERRYLERSNDLLTWVPVGILSPGFDLHDYSGGGVTVRFYRIRAADSQVNRSAE